MHIQSNIITFATGFYVPLALMPEGVLFVMRLLPFAHVVYTPTMLLCGLADLSEGLFGLFVITTWTLIMYGIAQYTYGRLRIKYDGVGI
jgi:ABC-type uncharacterized transport system permease subunit